MSGSGGSVFSWAEIKLYDDKGHIVIQIEFFFRTGCYIDRWDNIKDGKIILKI